MEWTSSPKNPKVDAVIPIWNQRRLTQQCLESILQNTEEPVRLILIDNGSLPETRHFLEQVRVPPGFQIKLIRNPENVGFIKAVNQGIRAGDAPWIVILNNDTIVTPGWLTEMLRVASSDPTIGLVNPTSNSLGFHAGTASLESYAAALRVHSGTCTELSTGLGFCLLGPRPLLESLGGLDESFGMGYFDDDDLSRRAKQAGYRVVRACASYVYHQERASFKLLPRRGTHFKENRRIYEGRWGRRLRILWTAFQSVPSDAVRTLAAQGHWVTLLSHSKQGFSDLDSTAQVSLLALPPKGWRLKATLRLLMRRKKPFDLVISSDEQWSLWLTRLRFFHKARVLHQPDREEILQACQKLSRCPS